MKKLPFSYPPVVDTYSGVAGNVAIQMCDSSYTPLLIYNHFLITYDDVTGTGGFNWLYYNDNYGHYFDLKPIIIVKGIINAIIDAINNKYYIHAYLDHFYIPQADSYLKQHVLHDCATIIGYDSENNIFFVADNFKNGKYEVLNIGFEDIEKAIYNNKNKEIEYFFYDKNIEFNLSKTDIVKLLKSYYNKTCYLSEINKKNSVYKLVKQKYGLEIYDVLIQQCYDMISYEYRIDDYRMFHLMCNHMNIGVLLVEYLKSEAFEENALCNKISNKYIELYNQMIYIRNLFIKSSICKDAKKVLKVIELIKDIKEQERKFLLSILQKLEVDK